jgi:hypothetical protein
LRLGAGRSWRYLREHVWTHQGEIEAINGQRFSVLANAFVLGSAVPIVSSTGWQIAGGMNVKF